jgi:hypothetical protein
MTVLQENKTLITLLDYIMLIALHDHKKDACWTGYTPVPPLNHLSRTGLGVEWGFDVRSFLVHTATRTFFKGNLYMQLIVAQTDPPIAPSDRTLQ